MQNIVIFDMDGTLIDSKKDIQASIFTLKSSDRCPTGTSSTL